MQKAAVLNASDLQKAADHLLEVLDPDGHAAAEERALDRLERSAHLNRFLTIVEDGLGGVRLRGRGTVEDAAVIKAALASLSAPSPADPAGTHGTSDPDTGHGCGTDGRDTRDHGARTWDALVEACQRLARCRGAARGPRHQTPRRGDDRLRPAPDRARCRDPGHRGPAVRGRGPPAGLRRRDPARGPRHRRGGPRRRPHPTPGHRRDLEGTGAAGPALPVPRLPDGSRSPATPTTSSTGPTAARPACRTWCCCAGPTTP